MAFDRKKLREYLKENGITQADLAFLAGKDIRTIRRWLSPTQRLTLKSINQICHALDVSPEQFDPETTGTNSGDHNVQIGARVSVAAANGYTLLRKEYGITHKQLIELAPVMFSIIARRALGLSRRLEQNLADAEAAIQWSKVDVQIDPFGEYQRSIDNARASEDKGWLFGDERHDGGYRDCHEEPTNLFCKELTELSKDMEDVLEFRRFDGCPTSRGFPLSTAIIDEFTCGNTSFRDHITYGDINLGVMDEHLWHPENSAERMQWLKQEVLKSKGRRQIKDEAWRKSNPEQAKARDELMRRIDRTRGKVSPNVVELKQDGGHTKW